MKRIIALFLSVILLFSCLVSCEKEDDTTPQMTSSEETTTKAHGNETQGEDEENTEEESPIMKLYGWYERANNINVKPISDGVNLKSKTLKVLVIGDSKAADSVNYVDKIALEMGYSNVKVGCAYNFYGATLNEIEASVKGTTNDSQKIYFIYREKNSSADSSGSYEYKSYNQCIGTSVSSCEWDVILIAENLYDAVLESTYTADSFKNTVNKICALCPSADIYYFSEFSSVKTDILSNFDSIMKAATRTTATADKSKYKTLPGAVAIKNALDAFPYGSEMTNEVANYITSLLTVSKASGKSPSSTYYDEDIFSSKVNFAIVREAVSNAIENPSGVTKSKISVTNYESKDDSDEDPRDFAISICEYENDKSGAISLTFDDGDVASAEICAQLLKKYNVKASFAIQVNLKDIDNERWVRWYNLVNGEYKDYIDLCSHDYTGYQNNAAGKANEYNQTVQDLLDSATLAGQMNKLLYSFTVLSAVCTYSAPVGYCTPGAGTNILNRRVQMKFPIFSADRIGTGSHSADGWKSNRLYDQNFTEEDYYSLGSTNIYKNGNVLYTNHSSKGGAFEDAESNYGWIIPLQHGIIPKGDTNTSGHTAAQNSEGITGYVDITREGLEEYLQKLCQGKSGSLWFATYNDVIKYSRERKASTTEFLYKHLDSFAFTVTNDLDERFDYPLTLKLSVPSQWLFASEISIRQGNRILRYKTKSNKGGSTTLYIYEVLPNEAPIYVEKLPE